MGSNGGTGLSVLAAAGDTRSETGLVLNDPLGLFIASEGRVDTTNTGVYTSLVRLASQLHGAADTAQQPLITIETDDATILVKAYDGHTVALRVPSGAVDRKNGTTSSAGAISAAPSEVDATASGVREIEPTSTLTDA